MRLKTSIKPVYIRFFGTTAIQGSVIQRVGFSQQKKGKMCFLPVDSENIFIFFYIFMKILIFF